MKIGIVSLTGCSGCQISLLDQKELLGQILADIKYATTLFDEKVLPQMDVCLVEGAIRNQSDLDRLHEAREKSEILVSLGSCAVYGGIQALGNIFQSKKIIEIVSKKPEGNPFNESPPLTTRVQSVDDIVEVDYYVPGCPPSDKVLEKALSMLFLGNSAEESKTHRLPVCATCDRTIKHQKIAQLHNISIPDPEICLLSQGYICLGSVTRGGCESQCPNNNVPCSGCRGPTDRVLLKPTHTVIRDFIKRVTHFSGLTEEKVKKKLMAIPWQFYPFTFASQTLKKKPHSEILELQASLSGGES